MDRRSFLLAASAAPFAAAAAAQAEPAASLGQFIREHAVSTGFSGSVLVSHGGKVVASDAFGLADRSFSVPARPQTRYRIASITKAFTVALILQLADQKRLDLDGIIAAYLPGYAGEGAKRVSVRQLLNHTSGISNMDAGVDYESATRRGIPAYQLPHSPNELLSQFASGKLGHEPGAHFDYNNADYVILGKIVEQLAGQTYEEALKARILGPLGMRDTGMAYQREVIPDLARTYFKYEQDPLINDLPAYPENWYAAGGLYSTAADLLTFADALFRGGLVSTASRAEMLRPGKESYGFGMWVDEMAVKGRKLLFAQRPGSIMGANTLLLDFPHEPLTIILLGNTNLSNTDEFGFKIAREILG